MKTSDETWEKDASCRKITDWILDEYTPEDYAERQQVCANCPVLDQCREWVDSFEKNTRRHVYDVYAGETPEERMARRLPPPEPVKTCREKPSHPKRNVRRHEERGEPLCSVCQAWADRKAADEKRWEYTRYLIRQGHNNHQISVMAGVHRDKVKRLREEIERDSVLA